MHRQISWYDKNQILYRRVVLQILEHQQTFIIYTICIHSKKKEYCKYISSIFTCAKQ